MQKLMTCPKNVLFIEELCSMMSELLPNIWKLGQAYFRSELHVKVEIGHKTEFKVIFKTGVF